MKKLIVLSLLCLTLTACGQKELTPNSVYNDELGAVLALGMTREEVESQLETTFDSYLFIDPSAPVEPEEYERDNSVSYGSMEDRVLVDYVDNVVVQINVGETELADVGTHWSLSGGVTWGSTEEEVLAALGEPTTWAYYQTPDDEGNFQEDKSKRGLHFYYNADHSRNMKATAPYYAVSVDLHNGIVSGMSLFQFGY